MPDYNPVYFIGGFLIFAAGALSMIFAYRYGEVSVLQPINSMSYVFSSIIGVFVLNEIFPTTKIIGIVLIISGVVVIGTSR